MGKVSELDGEIAKNIDKFGRLKEQIVVCSDKATQAQQRQKTEAQLSGVGGVSCCGGTGCFGILFSQSVAKGAPMVFSRYPVLPFFCTTTTHGWLGASSVVLTPGTIPC